MPTLEQMDITLDGIGHALADNLLSVPIYQRSYAWQDQHINDLFQDVLSAIKDDEPEYFLGSIVVTSTTAERPEVVDGQQRLATASILLAAIRDWLYEQGDTERAQDLQRSYLATKDLRTQDLTPRLRLNEIDHDFFERTILSFPDESDSSLKPIRDSQRRIQTACAIAQDFVGSLVSSSSSPVDYLIDWVEYLRDKVKIILVEVPDYSNAFTIFETLNDRGLDLAISDLLKNHLFNLSGDRITDVQERWISMFGALESVGGENISVHYIRHLWSSMYGATREKDLYDQIKARIRSRQSAIRLANDLAKNASVYAAILNPQHELWNDYGPTAKEHMETISLLRMIQIRPLLLAILDKFAPSEVRKTLALMVSWGVRFLVSGGLGGGVLERHYSDRAKDVRSGGTKAATQLRDSMKSVVPSNKQFETAFATVLVSTNYLARYYLRALENTARGNSQPELIPNPNQEVINLEHILPKSPSIAWSHIDEEVAYAYYPRIGNMALLKGQVNVKIGNDGFDDKKSSYAQSEYVLTKGLDKRKEWGPQEIEERQIDLATLAVKTWPLTIRGR